MTGRGQRSVTPPQRDRRLDPGLWIVATPIGNARDITLRALDVLRDADVLVCEDTRRTRNLLDLHGIAIGGRPVLSYNDHSGDGRRTAILDHVGAGKTVAYASDAGTPLIADPGYRLVGACHDRGFQVHTAPGPSAVTASLALGGLPTDRFLFAGFLPARKSARRRELETLSQVPATLVVFETGRRLAATLADISAVFGEAHTVCVARELTKRFEEVKTRPVSALISDIGETGDPKGEIVLLIDRLPAGHDAADVAERAEMLVAAGLADGQSVRDVADEVSGQTGLPRKAVYHMALSLSNAGR